MATPGSRVRPGAVQLPGTQPPGVPRRRRSGGDRHPRDPWHPPGHAQLRPAAARWRLHRVSALAVWRPGRPGQHRRGGAVDPAGVRRPRVRDPGRPHQPGGDLATSTRGQGLQRLWQSRGGRDWHVPHWRVRAGHGGGAGGAGFRGQPARSAGTDDRRQAGRGRRAHSELAVDEPTSRRVAVAFDELVLAI
jgi:hypothetical protein